MSIEGKKNNQRTLQKARNLASTNREFADTASRNTERFQSEVNNLSSEISSIRVPRNAAPDVKEEIKNRRKDLKEQLEYAQRMLDSALKRSESLESVADYYETKLREMTVADESGEELDESVLDEEAMKAEVSKTTAEKKAASAAPAVAAVSTIATAAAVTAATSKKAASEKAVEQTTNQESEKIVEQPLEQVVQQAAQPEPAMAPKAEEPSSISETPKAVVPPMQKETSEQKKVSEELKTFEPEPKKQETPAPQVESEKNSEPDANQIAAENASEQAAAERAAAEKAAAIAAIKAKQKADIQAAEEARARQQAQKEAEERLAREEAERIAAEKEAQRMAAEKEAARVAAQEAAEREAELLEQQRKAEEEAERIAAEKEAQKLAAEKEAARVAAQEESERKAREEAEIKAFNSSVEEDLVTEPEPVVSKTQEEPAGPEGPDKPKKKRSWIALILLILIALALFVFFFPRNNKPNEPAQITTPVATSEPVTASEPQVQTVVEVTETPVVYVVQEEPVAEVMIDTPNVEVQEEPIIDDSLVQALQTAFQSVIDSVASRVVGTEEPKIELPSTETTEEPEAEDKSGWQFGLSLSFEYSKVTYGPQVVDETTVSETIEESRETVEDFEDLYATYEFNYYGYTATIEAHDGIAFVTYPKFITSQEIYDAGAAAFAAYPQYLKGTRLYVADPGSAILTYPVGYTYKDFLFASKMLDTLLPIYIQSLFAKQEEEIEPQFQLEVQSQTSGLGIAAYVSEEEVFPEYVDYCLNHSLQYHDFFFTMEVHDGIAYINYPFFVPNNEVIDAIKAVAPLDDPFMANTRAYITKPGHMTVTFPSGYSYEDYVAVCSFIDEELPRYLDSLIPQIPQAPLVSTQESVVAQVPAEPVSEPVVEPVIEPVVLPTTDFKPYNALSVSVAYSKGWFDFYNGHSVPYATTLTSTNYGAAIHFDFLSRMSKHFSFTVGAGYTLDNREVAVVPNSEFLHTIEISAGADFIAPIKKVDLKLGLWGGAVLQLNAEARNISAIAGARVGVDFHVSDCFILGFSSRAGIIHLPDSDPMYSSFTYLVEPLAVSATFKLGGKK